MFLAHAKTCQNVSRCVQMCQHVSSCVMACHCKQPEGFIMPTLSWTLSHSTMQRRCNWGCHFLRVIKGGGSLWKFRWLSHLLRIWTYHDLSWPIWSNSRNPHGLCCCDGTWEHSFEIQITSRSVAQWSQVDLIIELKPRYAATHGVQFTAAIWQSVYPVQVRLMQKQIPWRRYIRLQ